MSAEEDFLSLMSDANEPESVDGYKRLVSDLRKQIKTSHKDLTELRNQVTEQAKVSRSSSLKEALESAGAKAGLAKYFPADAEVSTEAVANWLKEDGELFGYQAPTTPESNPEQDAARIISSVQPVAPPANDLIARVQGLAGRPNDAASAADAGTALAELQALMRGTIAQGSQL